MVDKLNETELKNRIPKQNVETITSNDHFMDINFVRDKLEQIQSTLLRDVENRMAAIIDEVMQEMRLHKLKANEFQSFAHPHTNNQIDLSLWNNRVEASKASASDDILKETDSTTQASTPALSTHVADSSEVNTKIKRQRRRALPDKVFVIRESYLTALLEVNHMKTIYHIWYIILLTFLMNSVCYDYFVEGRINFGLGTFKTGLAKIHYVLGVWLLEHVFVVTLYYAVQGWATVRGKLYSQRMLQRFWSHSCLIIYISSQLVFGYVASVLCLRWNLPFVTASVLLLETTRMLMKMHAYVRTIAARVIAGKLKTDDAQINIHVPSFGSYLYFLFAPTLIYRDSYPRTKIIRWRFALARFLEVVAVAFLYSYIHERYILVHFGDYGREPINASALIVKLFGMVMPSVIIFLCGFYLLLHSWLNFTSELLRFGDRMFYKDWWTAHTYDAYYRNWNVVVHDWLYEYVYKDFYTHIFKESKVAASLMVFAVSALVHEHVLGFALQLFFPIIFLLFGVVGVALVFLMRNAPKSLGNIFLWFSLIFGNCMMISLYSMEFYARHNCPKTYKHWQDYLMPAVWNC